jgi:putative ABC transport system ATP-binding protein
MLSVSNATKIFFAGMPDEKKALDDVNLVLGKGEFCIVIGSNGAGKSSLLNAIAGKLLLDTGKIAIADEDVTQLLVHQRARHLARVFQDPLAGTAASMTVAENLLLSDLRGKRKHFSPGLTKKRRRQYEEKLSILGLGLEERLNTPVELLSGGQRQSLALIMAVSNSPQILLLDEHTAALDPRTADIVMNATIRTVERFGLTTLMVTHNMQHAVDYGSRIVMMSSGKIRLEIAGERKTDITVGELVSQFSVKNDKVLLQECCD